MTRILTDLRSPQIRDLSAEPIAILPIGSAEQHGPHLPLSTDFVIADSLSRDVLSSYG
jgi:creatinine amidohydrolase